MPKLEITEKLLRAVIVNNTKKYAEEYPVKHSEAFKDVALTYYYYSNGQLGQTETNKSKSDYIAMMYDFVFNESTLPNKWFNLICRYYQYGGCEFCELDKAYLELIRSKIIEEQEYFHKLEAETEKIRHILA